jgi:DNA-binding response OmpR family regulator
MFDGKHIVVIDDDPEMRDAVGEYLELRRFQVSLAGNGDEMHEILSEAPVDLILLDVGLPGTDGIELARQVKSQYRCGVIMVTGHGDTEDRVLGLETGADDYVVKPFNFRELLARIHSVLRRLQPLTAEVNTQQTQIVRFGEWIFDTSNQLLKSVDGKCPDLSAGELDILSILAGNADTAVSRHELLENTSHRDWGPLDRSVDVRISRLRKKLEQDPTKPKLIRTARNAGYILITD